MSTALDDSGSAIKIRARDVRMDFAIADERGRKQQIAALQDFNLDIREGEFFTLLGPSGCGKSTFLNVLAGLARKTGGSISIDGQPASGIREPSSAGNSACSGVGIYCPSCASALFLSG